ncbi:ACT domain-containing protein [Nocardioides terrisoli]|uniref:ACT domain-containing protein n=1 Tax=Nocardioides terrisoli TaxID=3388267 RepID=UPI00287BAEE7|nr:ACT domain-containing protein [Nocardioides marmorisolisilvae]
MSYLLRVQLPDVPGSLGRLASAVGMAGGNIDAIEIVSRDGGLAVDDVFLAADGGVMPDSIVSACQQIEGVTVLWISRYAAGTNLFLDLEAVESMTEDPATAANTLVDLVPDVFRVDWGLRIRRTDEGMEVLHRTSAAPSELPQDIEWPEDKVHQLNLGDLIVAGARIGGDEAIVIARRGGPVFLESELARLRHLAALAASISR